jgi:hypothetical protein
VIIGKDARADAVERVEFADRLELVLEIAEHEADQAFGLAALFSGLIPRLKC